MAKKVKLTKKQIPFLKADLLLDQKVIDSLSVVQDKFKNQFKNQIETAQSEALSRYTEKLDSLMKAKASMLSNYNTEIKKYQNLIKELKTAKNVPVTKSGRTKKK